jgi:hypothetical protein
VIEYLAQFVAADGIRNAQQHLQHQRRAPGLHTKFLGGHATPGMD